MGSNIDYSSFKIFKEYYVGLRKQEGDTPPLGFATPFENNSAGKKRIETVNRWCNNNSNMKFDNIPIKGFEISKSVRRVYWGGGNVVWRVYDPRGFEVEISSANLSRIIDSVGILPGGVINSNCVWGRLGSENILIPEGSELWNKQIDPTVKTKDYNVGDMVVLKNGDSVVYCGHLNVLISKQTSELFDYSGKIIAKNSHDRWANEKVTRTFVVSKMHVCHSSQRYIFRKNIEVNSVSKKGELSVKQVDKLINDYNNISYKNYISSKNCFEKIMFMSKDPITSYNIFMEEVCCNELKKRLNDSTYYSVFEFYIENKGEMFLIERFLDRHVSSENNNFNYIKLYSKVLDIKEDTIIEGRTFTNLESLSYNEGVKFYSLTLMVNNSFKCKAR